MKIILTNGQEVEASKVPVVSLTLCPLCGKKHVYFLKHWTIRQKVCKAYAGVVKMVYTTDLKNKKRRIDNGSH